MLQYRFTAYWVVASYVSLVVGKEPFALVSQTLQHLENFLKLWKMKPQLHDNIYIYIYVYALTRIITIKSDEKTFYTLVIQLILSKFITVKKKSINFLLEN